MKDIVAEGLLLFSVFATIVVMVLLIIKERRKQKTVDKEGAKGNVKRQPHYESESLYLD